MPAAVRILVQDVPIVLRFILQALIQRITQQFGGAFALALGDGENVWPAAAIQLDQSFAQMLQFEIEHISMPGKPNVKVLVWLALVLVFIIVEEVFDVPEAKEIVTGASCCGGRGPRFEAVDKKQNGRRDQD